MIDKIKKIYVKYIAFFLSLLILSAACAACTPKKSDGNSALTESQQETPQNSKAADEVYAPPAAEKEKFIGIETVDYPDAESVYLYDMMTDEQKFAYKYLSEFTDRLLESKGKESIHVTFEKPVSNDSMNFARWMYTHNFSVLLDITGSYILDRYSDDFQTVTGLDYTVSDSFDENLKKYTDVTDAAKSVLASLEHGGTDEGKAFAIAMWMADNVSYAYNYEERGLDFPGDAYGALIYKQAICSGYSNAYDLLCKMSGLETICVTGDTYWEPHAWNMIKINGNWYHVDTTWMTAEDLYGNLFIPDVICFSNGHLNAEYCENTLLRDYDKFIAPAAVSFDLYAYCHGTCEETVDYFRNTELSENTIYNICFDSQEEYDKFKLLRSTEIKNNIDGKTYYFSFDIGTDNKYCTYVNFIRKK